MTTLLTPLSFLMLILSWLSEPELTYTVQVSADLLAWETLPFVIAESAQEESVEIPNETNPVFARLRYSDDGDTNGNGLPDLWEWQQFGWIDADPAADPDRDGKSNYMEWLAGTDPLDFFDGETPIIRVSSGIEWIIAAGQASAQPVAVSLYHASGDPWPGAPVQVESLSGFAGLITADQPASEAVSFLTGWTDALGRLQPGLEAIHIVAPIIPAQRDIVRISAGRASNQLLVRSAGTGFGPPPRELRLEVAADGSTRLRWTGDPGEAHRFILEEADVAGNWRQVLSVATTELPEPDPLTGRFTLGID